MKAYWEAEIPEYWLVDARLEEPSFRILKTLVQKDIPMSGKANGWMKSSVFWSRFQIKPGRSTPMECRDFGSKSSRRQLFCLAPVTR